MQDNKKIELSSPNPALQSYTTTINRCKVIINFKPDGDGKIIETVKSMLLSTYYQDISQESDKKLAC